MLLRLSGARLVGLESNPRFIKRVSDPGERRLQRELEQRASKPLRLLRRMRANGCEIRRGVLRGDLLVSPASLITRRDADELARLRFELWELLAGDAGQ